MADPEAILRNVEERMEKESEEAQHKFELICDGWKVKSKYNKLLRRRINYLEKENVSLQMEMNLGMKYDTWIWMKRKDKAEFCKALTEKYLVKKEPVTYVAGPNLIRGY